MSKVLDAMMGSGRVDWDTAVDWKGVSDADTQGAANEARDAAQRYAEIAGYLEGKIAGKDHPHCVQSACAWLKAIRKAMGYTFP